MDILDTLVDELTKEFDQNSIFTRADWDACGTEFLKKLPNYLGVSYGGTLIKGDNFGIRVVKNDDVIKLTGPYKEMGKAFVTENGFNDETVAKKKYAEVANEWGCKEPIDYRPWG